jgi:uncharacterized RDD family membrane protein YckC
LKVATWGNLYWPIALPIILLIIFIPETIALVTNAKNTLSDWTWNILHVQPGGGPISGWTVLHFFVFVIWLGLVIWLTYHFFFRDITT